MATRLVYEAISTSPVSLRMMKREARLLLNKAIDSLVLSVEHFNRPSDKGRVAAVLILLDHSFEMLLKASIVQKGGSIRDGKSKETIGFDACVRRALSDGRVKFLSNNQAIALQTINGLRDAAQHHLIDVSEQQLYMHAQSGLTLFRDILAFVFGKQLSTSMPSRVLPVSTEAPAELSILFENEVEEIRRLLQPRKRRKTEAYARIRPLAILDASVRGEKLQPGTHELQETASKLLSGASWREVFPGAATIEFTSDGHGPVYNLRITKKQGVPIHLVPEGTPGASVVAVKRVDELGYYHLGRDQLAKQVGLSGPKTTAVIWYLGLKEDADSFKEIRIGGSRFNRYSSKAVDRVRDAIRKKSIDEIWEEYR